MALLDAYTGPQDLKRYSREDLQNLAGEVRELIIRTIAANGGHLAASLGAVELTIALHAVLDAPQDKIVWDVGHQAYAHKILTDRKDKIQTIRTYGGLAGFPKTSESPYDTFTVGHASTSVSAALGMARARDIKGEANAVFAVIGDGSFSGGMVYEALNNAGFVKNKNFVVILNDNGMSISKPVGTLTTMITKLRTSNLYTGIKQNTEKMIGMIPKIGVPLQRAVDKMIERTGGLILQELAKKEHVGFFHDLGFTYMGPVDGHDIPMMMAIFKYAKKYPGPLLIHVQTKKGKGYTPAEREPWKYHGVSGLSDVDAGALKESQGPSYTGVFAKAMLSLAAQNKRVCAITAAMPEGTGLQPFAEKYPERFFDVGIAEEHAVTFAAGLATQGLRPVVALYSTFMQRSYDQLVHDVAQQKLPVIFALDRAGLVGEDGSTHHGVFDYSYMRHVPNLIVAAPKDGNELKDMLITALASDSPFALRYPRGKALFMAPEREGVVLPVGKAEVIYGTPDAETVIWAVGTMVSVALVAAQQSGKKVCVVNARFVKPLDLERLRQTTQSAKKIITIEENSLQGGFGSAVAEGLHLLGITVPVKMLGIPDQFIDQGSIPQLWKDCGLTVESLLKEL